MKEGSKQEKQCRNISGHIRVSLHNRFIQYSTLGFLEDGHRQDIVLLYCALCSCEPSGRCNLEVKAPTLGSDIYTNNDMRLPYQSVKIGLPKIAES